MNVLSFFFCSTPNAVDSLLRFFRKILGLNIYIFVIALLLHVGTLKLNRPAKPILSCLAISNLKKNLKRSAV